MENLGIKKKLICLKCFKIPSISLNDDILHYECKCEEKEIELPLKDYLNKVKEISSKHNCENHSNPSAESDSLECKTCTCLNCALSQENDIIITKCTAHNKEKEYCCKKSFCKKYLCSNCILRHKGHPYYHIPSLISEINIEEFKNKIKEGEIYLNEVYPKMKDDYIKKIENEFKDNLNKNKNILELCSMIMDSCFPNKIININLLLNIQKINLHFKRYNNDIDFIKFIKDNNIYKKKIINKFDINNLRSTKTLNNHFESVNSLCLLNDGRLASCSNDNTIKLYNPHEEYKCELTITGHTNSVINLCVLDDGTLFSCSRDTTIRKWKVDNQSYRCLSTLTGHRDQVNKVIYLPSNRIASCSWDRTIKIWDCNSPYQCINTIKEHIDIVWSLLLMNNNKYIVSGSADMTLRVWDINTYNNICVIKDVYCRWWNSLIKIDNDKVAVGGKCLKVVNISTPEIEFTYQNEKNDMGIFSLLLLKDKNILFGDDNGNLYHYIIEEKKAKDKKEFHEDGINCLMYLNNDNIISCSFDKNITIWEILQK